MARKNETVHEMAKNEYRFSAKRKRTKEQKKKKNENWQTRKSTAQHRANDYLFVLYFI